VNVSISNTIRHNQPVGLLETSDQLVTEAATCTTHNNKETKIQPSAGFETAIPTAVRAQTYTIDRTATGICRSFNIKLLGGQLGRRNLAFIDQYALGVEQKPRLCLICLSFLSYFRYQSGPVVSEEFSRASYNCYRSIWHSKTTHGTL
jgi:hypothetical protein